MAYPLRNRESRGAANLIAEEKINKERTQMKKLSGLMGLFVLVIFWSVRAAAGVITVGCLTSNAITIQDGVSIAHPGDEVLVCPGTYNGGILIEKEGLKLRALGPIGTVTISGEAGSQPSYGIAVKANHVHIEGFEIYGFTGLRDASGIIIGKTNARNYPSPAGSAIIKGNDIHDNENGIYLWRNTSLNQIYHNHIYDNSDCFGKTLVQIGACQSVGYRPKMVKVGTIRFLPQ
jgi:parallel beta-helix repeat protein